MRYTYLQMPDKTKEGIRLETSKGLAVACVWFYTNMGIPLEVFDEWVQEKLPTNASRIRWYMNFRNEHPNLFA